MLYGSYQRDSNPSLRADVIIFMILGQSAAVAASIAIDRDLAVQDVPYQELSSILVEKGQILNY